MISSDTAESRFAARHLLARPANHFSGAEALPFWGGRTGLGDKSASPDFHTHSQVAGCVATKTLVTRRIFLRLLPLADVSLNDVRLARATLCGGVAGGWHIRCSFGRTGLEESL